MLMIKYILLFILFIGIVTSCMGYIEEFENQSKENLKIAEIAALEIDGHKKRIIELNNILNNTMKEININVDEYKVELVKIHTMMKEELKQAIAAEKRIALADPKSYPAARSREMIIELKNIVDSIKI